MPTTTPPAQSGDIEQLKVASAPRAALAAEPALTGAAVRGDRVAVFVCHGMGQQVPFETVDMVSTTLARFVESYGGRASLIEVGLAHFPGRERPLPRATTSVSLGGLPETEVHVFESYWAPITEGNVTLRDVMRFLFDAGFGGIRKIRYPFSRWAFGGFQDFGRSFRAPAFLLLALLVVAALVLVNAAIVGVTTARFLSSGPAKWPGPMLVADLTVALVTLLAAFVFAAVVFRLAGWRHKRHAEARHGWDLKRSWLRLWVFFTVVAVWGSIAAVLMTAVTMARQFVWHQDPAHSELSWWAEAPGRIGSFDWTRWTQLAQHLAEGHAVSSQALVIAAVWLLAFLISAGVRNLLVQYVGDVAAYVSAHEASRFRVIRSAIQKEAFDVAQTVYAARDADGALLYDRIVVAGHSLGSVVAYDTLNAVINGDRFAEQPCRAAERTSMLLTFGSPLDKTAFVFRNQKAHRAPVREAMAAQMQPLLLADAHRPRRWVNVHSRHDWISGPLNYYERATSPGSPEPDFADAAVRRSRVQNIADPFACLHVMAHTQYWLSPFLANLLYQGITDSRFDALQPVAGRSA